MDTQERILLRWKLVEEIVEERFRQDTAGPIEEMEEFDKSNTQNDWVGYICAYAGRAASKVIRNQKENQTFRDNMVKVAALALAAIEAYDKGYCPDVKVPA